MLKKNINDNKGKMDKLNEQKMEKRKKNLMMIIRK